jgi:hypothetical protein
MYRLKRCFLIVSLCCTRLLPWPMEKTKMKLIHVIFISLSVIAYGMPIQAQGQFAAQVFTLSDVRAGEACRINIELVLRDKYRQRLETDSGSHVFRWTFNGGELPPGLVLHPNGIVTGTPRSGRTQSYNFQVKVNAVGAEPFILDLSLTVIAPQIRLVQVNALKLVPLEPPDGRVSAPSSNNTSPEGARVGGRVKINLIEGAPNETWREPPTTSTPQTDPSALTSAVSDVRASMMRPQNLPSSPCDINTLPAPSATPGADVFRLDARNGNLYDERDQLVTSPRRFKRNERAVIIVDNKNPYLYTYKLTIQSTPVLEPALDAFVPLIVGSLGEFKAKPPAPPSAPTPTRTPGPGLIEADACKPAKDKVNALMRDKDNAVREMSAASRTIEDQRTKSRSLTDSYNSARLPLFTPNQTRERLYNASRNFIQTVDGRIGSPNGVDRATLDTTSAELERLRRVANTLKSRVETIRAAHPTCLDVDNGGELISEQLRRVTEAADELLADAARFERALNEIRTDLQKVIDARTSVLRVLCDPHAFFSESVVGQFEETNDVDIQLEVTPRQGVTEAQQISGSPFKTKFTFGNAPFFSISGGLIFTPLRKREYIRVQGFELDAQGNQVLVNGKPNLTTVIGLKESSPTRIIPAVFLNGLLTQRKTGFIDGVHLSVGITAKNDNKGTDVEFLVGPSLSMLERRMFFTFGGYAGKQQKLAGNLFEGFALPSGVSEIPVEKNYRWHVGFALSYRIPVTK